MSFNKNEYALAEEYTTELGTTIKICLHTDDPDGAQTKEGVCKAMVETAGKLLSKYY